jgi:hypothetical protein
VVADPLTGEVKKRMHSVETGSRSYAARASRRCRRRRTNLEFDRPRHRGSWLLSALLQIVEEVMGNDPFATTGNRTVGSNPTPSAKNSVFPVAAPFCFLLWHFSRIFRGLSAAAAVGPLRRD